MRIIGLTGGIASGKSTVAQYLSQQGVTVFDADQLAREVVEPGQPAHAAIVAYFGDKVLNPDGALNRQALGNIIFADPVRRKELEKIIHPAIARLADERIASLRKSGAQLAVYMAPLLIEAGITARVDEIWVVYVDRDTQLLRLMARDGISRELAEQKIEAQMPMDEKKSYGKVVIDNRGTPENTRLQVQEAWERVKTELANGSESLIS